LRFHPVGAIVPHRKETIMFDPTLFHSMAASMPLAAAGWALLYLLFGGGLGGAFLLFIVLKMFGK
jgi:hypothetical protein